jgi:hypothetical protein
MHAYNISYINMCRLNKNREWRKEWVSGDYVCDCSFGELLDNKKPFRPLYIFKHMLKSYFVLFIRERRITTSLYVLPEVLHGDFLSEIKYLFNLEGNILHILTRNVIFFYDYSTEVNSHLTFSSFSCKQTEHVFCC